MREQLFEVINVTWAGHNLFFTLTIKIRTEDNIVAQEK